MATVGIVTRLVQPLGPVGKITKWFPEFGSGTRLSDWEIVQDPTGRSRNVLKNYNRSTQGEDHSTATTGRELKPNETSHRTVGACYMKPEDLKQTGRNLVWQLQMDKSPILALSTKNGYWQLVHRVGGAEHRISLGPIRWGVWIYIDVIATLKDAGGSAKAWWSYGPTLPDVTAEPVLEVTGDTYQGRLGHDTIGQYSQHSSPGTYVCYFDIFGRGKTAVEARSQAGPV